MLLALEGLAAGFGAAGRGAGFCTGFGAGFSVCFGATAPGSLTALNVAVFSVLTLSLAVCAGFLTGFGDCC